MDHVLLWADCACRGFTFLWDGVGCVSKSIWLNVVEAIGGA